jgi:hypothetical protein
VRYYFDNLCSALRELELTNSPAQIWNCDETGVSAQGRCMERVICPKGMAAKVQRSACRENVSIMGCINAAGGYIPPMYIYAGARRKMEWLPGAPDGAVCAVTESSNINTDLFLIWFEWFVDQLPPVRPQLLVLDGHFAHVSVATVKYGIDRDAYLFVLPAHTSHFLQPLDVAVYQPFKALYEREVQRYPLNNCGALPVKDNIAGMTHDAFVMAFSDKNIRRGFRDTGIYPLSLEVMLQKMGGNKPCTTAISLRHHAVVVPQYDGEEVDVRTLAAVKRRKLDLDALNVVNLSMKRLLVPKSQQRPPGHFVDENVSGGKLLSYDDMMAKKQAKLAAEQARQDAKEETKRVRQEAVKLKAASKQSRPQESRERTDMCHHDKARHQTPAIFRKCAKQRRQEDVALMRSEDFNVGQHIESCVV